MTVGELAEEIYREHYGLLLNIARRNCGGLDAEALLHDAFILFTEHFDPHGGAPPLAWMQLTLKRHCWESYKRERRRGAYQPYDESAIAVPEEARASRSRTPDEEAEARETVREAALKLMSLKPAERTALGDLALGFSYKEIEVRRGWTYTKINRCIAEGRAALKAAT